MSLPEETAGAINQFLADASRAVAIEDGAVMFDFATARYSVSTEHGKCLLHLWSSERNAVRRVTHAERKGESLRLTVQRFGQTKPTYLTLARDADQRSPSERRAARLAYAARLRGLLERRFAGWTIEQLTSEADLRRSFSSVYTRGLLRQGTRSFALLGVNGQESQATVDAALTFGILWLEHCRQRGTERASHVEGLKLLVPPGASRVARERMAHLDRAAAHWQLYEYDEREGSLLELDAADRGNVETRLTQCPEEQAARERFAASIREVMEMVPGARLEVGVRSAGEIGFRLHGLEVARARLYYPGKSAADLPGGPQQARSWLAGVEGAPEPRPGQFHMEEQITFGAGANETVLTAENRGQLQQLLAEVLRIRQAGGERTHPLWRMAPEHWLESLVAQRVDVLDGRLAGGPVYAQVPAMAGGDRGLVDLLTITRDGRLAVIELKADDDIHLPLQGVDYWARVEWHRARGEFERHGYFPHAQLAPQAPLLLLVSPALRVHPATDTLLRHLSPEIDVTLVALDERWRDELRVIFRKRPERRRVAMS